VGCYVDSCRACERCQGGEEQYYGTPSLGGYSTSIVVDERYALRIPTTIEMSAAARLLCAGIALYSPSGTGVRDQGNVSPSSAWVVSATSGSGSRPPWALTSRS
jgi:D-arabinose 1-dehydrogenase-like Zn-dependent alcohol dehydrogenase